MKLLQVFLLFLILIPGTSSAQNDSVSLVAYWVKGETKEFKVSKSKIQYREGKITKDEVSSHISVITVLDSTKKSFLLEWKCENNVLTGSPLPIQMGPLAEKYKYLTVKYTTDENGVFEGISNMKEIASMIQEIFKLISSDMEPEELKVFNSLKQIYSSPDAIEGLLLKELQLIHWPMGVSYRIQDSIKYEEKLPNFLGGDPINATRHLVVDSVNRSKSLCYIVNSLLIGEADSKRVVNEMLLKVSSTLKVNSVAEKEKKISEMKNLFDKMSMQVKDNNTFIYNYKTGWPVKIVSTRKMQIKSQEVDVEQIEEMSVAVIR